MTDNLALPEEDYGWLPEKVWEYLRNWKGFSYDTERLDFSNTGFVFVHTWIDKDVPLPEGVPFLRFSGMPAGAFLGEEFGDYGFVKDEPEEPLTQVRSQVRSDVSVSGIDWEASQFPAELAEDLGANIREYVARVRRMKEERRRAEEERARQEEEAKQRAEEEERRLHRQPWIEAGVIDPEDRDARVYTLHVQDTRIADFVREKFAAALDQEKDELRFVSTSKVPDCYPKEKYYDAEAEEYRTRRVVRPGHRWAYGSDKHVDPETEDLDDYAVVDYAALAEEVDAEAERLRKDRVRRSAPFVGHVGLEAEQDEPSLIDGYVRLRGVSVVDGDFDSFKTTCVLDWAVHVAYGLPWQGRKVTPRPVIWYALEGADELPKRIAATQAKLGNGKGSVFGEGAAPIKLRQRLPDGLDAWRKELREVSWEIASFVDIWNEDHGTRYPNDVAPMVVVDTLSHALGEEDERGARAVGFINDCIKLTVEIDDEDEYEERVAEHVVLIHHTTKTGDEFAGHRAIAANTHALYYVRRRSGADTFRLEPRRVKGMARPPAMHLETEVVTVPGTRRTTVVVKDKCDIDERLAAVVGHLEDASDPDNVTEKELRAALDAGIPEHVRNAARRKSRSRLKKTLIDEGRLVSHEHGYRLVLD